MNSSRMKRIQESRRLHRKKKTIKKGKQWIGILPIDQGREAWIV